MPGTSNFQQWNPTQTNQESDASYTSDTLRSGGLANPSIFPSVTGNKLFYQVSTFVTAFANMLAAKNYSVSDSNLATLQTALANVMTLADMSAYAPIASPALTGSPSAPTPSSADNSTRLATTAWVTTNFYVRRMGFCFSGA
jgi:hypothetical protein